MFVSLLFFTQYFPNYLSAHSVLMHEFFFTPPNALACHVRSYTQCTGPALICIIPCLNPAPFFALNTFSARSLFSTRRLKRLEIEDKN